MAVGNVANNVVNTGNLGASNDNLTRTRADSRNYGAPAEAHATSYSSGLEGLGKVTSANPKKPLTPTNVSATLRGMIKAKGAEGIKKLPKDVQDHVKRAVDESGLAGEAREGLQFALVQKCGEVYG